MSKKSYFNIECPHCGEEFGEDECYDLDNLIDEAYDDGWEDSKKATEKQRLEENDGAILTAIAKIIERQQYGFGMTKENAYDEIIGETKRRKHVTD